jgi:hypothetical protein
VQVVPAAGGGFDWVAAGAGAATATTAVLFLTSAFTLRRSRHREGIPD